MKDADIIQIEAPEARATFDRPRTLRLNNRALIKAKQGLKVLRGASGGPVYAWEFNEPDDEALTALIWGMLLHEQPDLDIWTVADWLHPGNRAQVAALIRGMLEEANPEPTEAGASDPLAGTAAA